MGIFYEFFSTASYGFEEMKKDPTIILKSVRTHLQKREIRTINSTSLGLLFIRNQNILGTYNSIVL